MPHTHDTMEDAAVLRRQRQFLHEVEQGIRTVNREVIHARIPQLTAESFERFARMVARLRAVYLEAAMVLVSRDEVDGLSPAAFAALRHHRESFEEARDAFDALQRAIERGYVDLSS